MYRVEFGRSEKRTLYIFNVVDDVIPDTYLDLTGSSPAIEFNDVTGSSSSCNIRFDENKNNKYYPSEITKTSLEVELIRRNDTDFNDIIQGNDNEWYGLVTKSTTELDVSSGKRPIVRGGDVAFLGKLNNEQYGETYDHSSPVKLFFHDRIGEISQQTFEPSNNLMALPEIFYQLLSPVIAKKRLHIEFSYTIDVSYYLGVGASDVRYDNLESPSQWFLDVANFKNKKSNTLLESILKDHDLAMYVDYNIVTISESDYSFLEDIGCIRVEHLDRFTETEREYFVYVDNGTSYTLQVNKEEVTRAPVLFREEYPIVNKTGRWELVRKAKYIDAIHVYERLDNLVFPAGINSEDCIDANTSNVPEPIDYRAGYYSLYHPNYRLLEEGDLLSSVMQEASLGTLPMSAHAENVTADGATGLILRDSLSGERYLIGQRIPVMVGHGKMTITAQGWTNHPPSGLDTNYIKYALIGYSPQLNLYVKWNGSSWTAWDRVTIPYLKLIITESEFTVGQLVSKEDEVGQANGVLPIFQLAYIVPIFYAYNANSDFASTDYLLLTDFKLSMVNSGTPNSLKVRTSISETMRSPIEEKFTFCNLPALMKGQSFYKNGIYAKGLDYYVDDVLQTNNPDNIIAPPYVTYDGNSATMLVHNSEARGEQMLLDRWKFKARIIMRVKEAFSLYYASWYHDGFYVCEKDTTITEQNKNTGYQRAIFLGVTKSQGGEFVAGYPEYYDIRVAFSTYAVVTSTELSEMSTVDYLARASAFETYVSGIEGTTLEANNQPRIENLTGCPLGVTIIYSITWGGTTGVDNGFKGEVKLEKRYGGVVNNETISTIKTSHTGSLNSGETGEFRLLLDELYAYINTIQTSTNLYHRYSELDSWVSGSPNIWVSASSFFVFIKVEDA